MSVLYLPQRFGPLLLGCEPGSRVCACRELGADLWVSCTGTKGPARAGATSLLASLSHTDERSPSSWCGSLLGEGRAHEANGCKVFCSPKNTQSFNPSFLIWLCKALFQNQLNRVFKASPIFVHLPAFLTLD